MDELVALFCYFSNPSLFVSLLDSPSRSRFGVCFQSLEKTGSKVNKRRRVVQILVHFNFYPSSLRYILIRQSIRTSRSQLRLERCDDILLLLILILLQFSSSNLS